MVSANEMLLCKYVNPKYDLETKDCLTVTIKQYISRSIKQNFFLMSTEVAVETWKGKALEC